MPVSAMAVMASAPVGRRPTRSARTRPRSRPDSPNTDATATMAAVSSPDILSTFWA